MPPRRKNNQGTTSADDNARPKKLQSREQVARPSGQIIKVDKPVIDQLNDKIEEYQAKDRNKQQDVKSPVPAAELQEAAGTVVRAMLFRNLEKPGHPVRRQDLLEILKKQQHAKSGRHFATLAISAAQAMCCRVFGLEMVELHREAAAGASRGDATTSYEYVLKSMLPYELRHQVVEASGATASDHRGFIMLIMALIQMEGGKIEKESLFELLSHVGVKVGVRHPRWDVDPEDEVKKLENKRWLVISKRRGGAADGGDQIFYERGEVAKDHISDAEVQAFIDMEFQKGGVQTEPEAPGSSAEDEVMELD